MDVSIIIINYKTLHLIINCIYSIFKHVQEIEYEIIVVDNNSMDNFQNILHSKFGENIKCISLSQNIGFGRANNEGLRIAKGRNVFFLNPDTILLNNAVKILSDYLDHNPNIGACGGNLYDENFQPSHSYKMFLPSLFWEINDMVGCYIEKVLWKKNRRHNHKNIPLSVGYITGADLMIRATLLDKIGGFSKLFFMYYEETELCYRIKKYKYKIYSVPTARIQHLEGKSFNGKINESKISYQEFSHLQYYRLCYKNFYQKLCFIFYFIHLNSRIITYKILRKKYNYQYWSLKKKYFIKYLNDKS